MPSIRLVLAILLVGIIFSGIALLIAQLEKGKRFLKYLPSLLLLITAIVFFIISRRPSQGFQDLANIILAMIAFGSGVIALLTAIIIDIYKSRKVKEIK